MLAKIKLLLKIYKLGFADSKTNVFPLAIHQIKLGKLETSEIQTKIVFETIEI
jgi:hypothetical protein